MDHFEKENGQNMTNLRDYYNCLFPSDLIFQWLSYGQEQILQNREFAFILKDDIHIRYLSFSNGLEEFREKLQQKCPEKIDIGAIYNRPPCDRKKVGDFVPVERELVFDIDLTDYDGIRNCCSGTTVCAECWRWIVIAVRVLEHLLTEHFGFMHLLWVFSGRRGLHCWVADKKARTLKKRVREAIVKYLTFNKNSSVINEHRVHPLAEHSYRQIMDSGQFDRLVISQGWLDSEERWKSVLELCGEDATVRALLENEFKNLPTPQIRWESLKLRFDSVERMKYRKAKGDNAKLPLCPETFPGRHFLRYFVLSYAHPRLDEKVSTGINHLLKCPFSVHPKTGNVAVPLSARTIDRFIPTNTPNIEKLTTELRKIKMHELKTTADDTTISNQQKILYYNQTSLAPYAETFRAFVDAISEESTKAFDDDNEMDMN